MAPCRRQTATIWLVMPASTCLPPYVCTEPTHLSCPALCSQMNELWKVHIPAQGPFAASDVARRFVAGGVAGVAACALVSPRCCCFASGCACWAAGGRMLVLGWVGRCSAVASMPTARAPMPSPPLTTLPAAHHLRRCLPGCPAGLPIRPCAHAAGSADHAAILHRHCTRAAHDRCGGGNARAVPRPPGHAGAGAAGGQSEGCLDAYASCWPSRPALHAVGTQLAVPSSCRQCCHV